MNQVATFVRSGNPEAQEVRIDLLLLFETSQNLTNSENELYGCHKDLDCTYPILQNEIFSKDATMDLLFGDSV